jgi:putative transcriptional regulator
LLRFATKNTVLDFARYLNLTPNLTPDHVSKLERDEKRPTGPALVLLNVIRRKGIEAIL